MGSPYVTKEFAVFLNYNVYILQVTTMHGFSREGRLS